MMPAMRAAPNTSPFFASPFMTRSSVACDITMRAFGDGFALGRGLVRHIDHPRCAFLAEMGQLERSRVRSAFLPRFGSLFLFEWLSGGFFARAMAYPAARMAAPRRQKRAGRGRDIGRAHQAFADQEGRNADFRQPREIGGRVDPAFADDDAVCAEFSAPALR